jgi:hypothetical protein
MEDEQDRNTAEIEWDDGAATVAGKSPTAVFFDAAADSLGRFHAALAEAGQKWDGLEEPAQLDLVRGLIGILRSHYSDTHDLLRHMKGVEIRLQAIEDGK